MGYGPSFWREGLATGHGPSFWREGLVQRVPGEACLHGGGGATSIDREGRWVRVLPAGCARRA